MRRKKERSKQGQTNKAKQHSTPKAATFPELPRVGLDYSTFSSVPKKNELPQVGLKPTTLYTLDTECSATCTYMCSIWPTI